MKLKHLLTLLCLVFSISVTTAQKPIKVKKVTEKLMFSNAKYEVLKSDREIKHGFYKEYDFLYKKQIVLGNYYLGEKDGIWEEWYHSIAILKNEGNFKKGQQVGVWKYYDYEGELLHIYNHDTKTLLFSSECGNVIEYEVLINEESIWTKLDCPPAMIGGIINLSIDITNTYFMSKRDNTNNIGGIYEIFPY
jgi:antitoxin component YwqK of YwqJK toxin-antitoxin module